MPATSTGYETIEVRAPQTAKGKLIVTSEAFSDGDEIPMKNVSDGAGGGNQSPQISWSGAPPGTKSFAITCFDPDAPTGSGYWHWLAWGIPASVTKLDAGAGTGRAPAGAQSGYGDSGTASYDGPAPPKGDGDHRYIFTVYALDVDTPRGATDKTTGAGVIFRMRGHLLASGSITGRFGH
ncbi:MAG TPA: YbhB/YbcL family Raf kinase inhibitor-like protein [Gemmatimonadaceae bacterium]|nr:YbhB/YbcL family Raf kinase inhibitor-like protein [Gemmatimonadaceae bacterium]